MKNFYTVELRFRTTGESVRFEIDSQATLDVITAMARASGVGMDAHLCQRFTLAERLRRWRAGVLAWLQPLIFVGLLLGSSSAFAQKPAALTPTRVSIAMLEDGATNVELLKLLRAELQRRRTVVFVSQRIELDVLIATARPGEGMDCLGIAAAMVTTDQHGKQRLSIHTGSDLQSLARHLADKLTPAKLPGLQKGR